MTAIRLGAILSAVFTLSSAGLRADGPDSAQVSVTATRIPESPTEVPPAVTIVSAADIGTRGAKTVADAVKLVTGVSLSADGPEGAQVGISLRGSTTNEVLVLVDGVRVNNALSGLADLSALPADSIDRIEVVREGGSALYGGDAVGGVVNIITKKKSAALTVTVENGSFLPSDHVTGYGFGQTQQPGSPWSLVDSQKIMFSWGPTVGTGLFHSSGCLTRAANAYTFLDANGNNRQLQNAGLVAGDGSAGLSFPWLEGTLGADAGGSYSQKGAPGSQTSPTLDASETDSTARASVRYVTDRFLADPVTLDATVHVGFTGIDYTDPDTTGADGHHKVYDGGLDLQQKFLVSDDLSFVYGGTSNYTLARSNSVGDPTRLATGAYFESVVDRGAFSFRPAVRYDYYSDFFSSAPWGGLGVTAAAAWKPSGTDVVKINISRSYRVPTFEDLYWPATSQTAGNPGLKPETAYAADLGYGKQAGAFSYQATVYVRYARDVILWQPGTNGVWTPSNFGAALYPGLEQEVTADLGNGYSATVNYTFLYSYVLDVLTLADDKRLPMTPVHTLNGTLGYASDPLSWSVSAKYRSLRFLTTANVSSLPDSFTLDAFTKWKVDRVSSVYVAVDNLFGEQYENVEDFPMPGTKVRLGLEMQF